jgi:hypothetical protein
MTTNRPAWDAEPVLQAPPAASSIWAGMRSWPRRRWTVAALGALATVVFMGVSTAMIPNPVFGRAVPTTWWAWPTLLVTAVLGGLLAATYVRGPEGTERASRSGIAGGLLGYFAVGCPVCNKVVLLALGYTGALTWFAPVQPVLAVAGVVLLAYAFRARLKGERACPVPVSAR